MSTTDDLVFKNYQLPKPSHAITHYVVKLFKSRLNSTTHVGFHCHCGHESKVQFPDYRAMTLLRIRTVPDNICDLVLAAWRAHTKDLEGVHPNAEDQIRDFFNRQLEQPGGPTMTRYPLTAIPIDTPKPKSIAISTVVDENLRSIIGDYAKKLGIDVDPMGTAEWDVANGPDRPWYASANVATATAMREYLARLLYGDEGLVENLQADEKGGNPWRQMPIPSKEMRVAWEKWDCLFTDPHGKRCMARRMLNTHIFRGNLQNFSGWGEPDKFLPFDEKEFNTSPNIFWRPSGKTWAEVEEIVKNTTPSDSQVNLANRIGKLAVEAVAQGESTFRANVTIPGPLEYLVFERPLKTEEADQTPTRIILRSYAADDKPRIERLLGLARQLQIPVQLAGPWSCTAFPKGEEAHPALDVVFPEVLVHPRDVLIVSDGDEYRDGNGENRLFSPSLTEAENQLLWAAREDDQRFITGLIELLGLPAEASRADIAAAVETKSLDGAYAKQAYLERTRYEECDERVREILGAANGEESVDAAKRVVVDLAEWKRGQESWKNDATTQRQETAENQRKLLDILNAGTVYPDWKHYLDYAEARMAKAAKFEEEVATALNLPFYTAHDRVIRELQTLLGERIESKEKIKRLESFVDEVGPERDTLKAQVGGFVVELANARAEINKLRELAKARVEIDELRSVRNTLKERIETAITAERQTIAQRIDLALTDKADCTNIDEMISWVRDLRDSRNKIWVSVVNLHTQIADALDAPPGERSFLTEDGSPNTALVDRIISYYKRLYTAAGYSEPPQGGWEEILTHIRKTTEFKPETPVTWSKYLIKPDNSKE